MNTVAVFVLLLTIAPQAPAPKEVPVTEEPSHHRVLENQYTRTYRVEVAPGKATLLHRHDHDYVFVAIGDAAISNEVLGKPAVEQKLKDGDVNFAPGGFAHVARNLASTPFRNVTIEVLRKSKTLRPPPPCNVSTGLRECIVIDTDAVKVTTETITPGGVIAQHRHSVDHLVVAISDLHLKNDVVGKGSSEVQQKAGDVMWVKGGLEHMLTNVGPQPAVFLMLEFR